MNPRQFRHLQDFIFAVVPLEEQLEPDLPLEEQLELDLPPGKPVDAKSTPACTPEDGAK